ncbi:hypothetical protein [Polaromonas sp. YR568]|uniref:hypothetical protein n=1 Tax=Polaromonas sp. YR568 TaxID=1855301 RepID=UPI00398C1538
MRTIRTLPALLACGLLAGCVTPLDISNYQKVGIARMQGNRAFVPDPAFSQPAYFNISPQEVASSFGHLCQANYNCTYFADEDAYYLLQNFGAVPALSVRSHAVAIVDGRTGKLLKSPAKP